MKFLVVAIFLVTCFMSASARDIHVTQHVWVGNDIRLYYWLTVPVPEGSKLYDVLLRTEMRTRWFEFRDNGEVVTSIAGNAEDPANNIRWVVFLNNQAPSRQSPPGAFYLSYREIHDVTVEDGEHYLFWLRTDDV